MRFKTKLFERRPQGYALTEAGERLLSEAESMESQALAVASEIGGSDLALSGTVRVGAPDGFGTYFLAAELGALAEQHPGLVLQLVALPRTFSLSKREADIATSRSNSRPRGGSYRASSPIIASGSMLPKRIWSATAQSANWPILLDGPS